MWKNMKGLVISEQIGKHPGDKPIWPHRARLPCDNAIRPRDPELLHLVIPLNDSPSIDLRAQISLELLHKRLAFLPYLGSKRDIESLDETHLALLLQSLGRSDLHHLLHVSEPEARDLHRGVLAVARLEVVVLGEADFVDVAAIAARGAGADVSGLEHDDGSIPCAGIGGRGRAGLAEPDEVAGDGGACYAGADDDDVCVGGQWLRWR